MPVSVHAMAKRYTGPEIQVVAVKQTALATRLQYPGLPVVRAKRSELVTLFGASDTSANH
jgi:hypothetical protein